MRRQLNSCASRAARNLHTPYGGSPEFYAARSVHTCFISRPVPSHPRPSSSPPPPTVHREPESSPVLFFFARKKRFRYQFAISGDGERETRSCRAREPRYPRFTVHLSVEESPSDKFQVSRLNERTVLPSLFVGEKKTAHYPDSRNFEIYRQPGRPDYG